LYLFQGVLILQDVYRATLQYSIPKESSERQSKASQDWFCIRCGAHNFKRRDSCFKCSAPRHESEAGEEGSDEVCTYPTNTILLRGLDVLSTEESVLQGIQHAGSDLPIRSVRIGRDPLTNTSRGVCYIELNSVLDSMQLHNKLVHAPPNIDNKQVTVSYCKLNQNNGTSNNWAAQQTYAEPAAYTAGADIKQLAEYSASLYAQTPEENASYVQYYTMYYQQQQQAYQQSQAVTSSSTQGDSVNAAAAVAQSALQAMQQKNSAVSSTAGAAAVAAASAQSTYSTTTATSTLTETYTTTTMQASYDATQAQNGEFPTYPAPDVSTYQYDETSGYYYDPSTGLYYDATSQYYYNAESGSYLYWDAEKSTYLPAPMGDTDDGKKGDKKDKDKEKQDKVKVAKKIAKDMARWAKAQNKRNETIVGKVPGAPPMPEPIGGVGAVTGLGTGAADAAFAVLLERRDRASLAEKQAQVFQMHMKKDQAPVLGSNMKKSGLVAAYGGEGSEDEEEELSGSIGGGAPASANDMNVEEKLVDYAKLACLLCKRQFPNKEALNRHVQLSDLHKTNIENLKKSKGGDSAAANSQQYRDRAKERRQKYGEPAVPAPNKLKERYMAAREEVAASKYEQPTKEGIGTENIGNKLLKKMGWTDGQGLGKTNQGRTAIIETERRVSSAGLGMQGSNYSVVGDSYKDCVKKMMFHRYQELDQQEKEPK